MNTRGILRIVMVALALGVSGLVYWQWSGDTRQTNSQPSLSMGEGPELLFRTEGLDYTHTVNGVPRYRASAEASKVA